ncbi:MAG: triphosphoribosyl-dephospho-CoA synthase [Geminicoccaceae bacterium]
MSLPPAAIAAAFVAACRAELLALKPGNVHVHAAGHGMTVRDFERSAEAAAPEIAASGRSVGERILAAVAATRAAVGQNTNLGIVLLAAPLAVAAETGAGLAAVLDGLTVADAAACYRAIRLAAPGGLGHAERHDVAEEPEVSLLEAMRAAAARDRIAWQYAHAFADVRGLGVARLRALRAAGWAEDRAVSATYLAFLGACADSHVLRKHGSATAERVRRAGAALERGLMRTADPTRLWTRLRAFDQALKRRGINPGTSADLTVASHLASALLN